MLDEKRICDEETNVEEDDTPKREDDMGETEELNSVEDRGPKLEWTLDLIGKKLLLITGIMDVRG